MKITDFHECPEKCYRFRIDNEDYNGYFIEVKDDGEVFSAYLCEEMWPRRKEIVYYEYVSTTSFEGFMEALKSPIVESYIHFTLGEMSKLRDIPS